MKPIGPRDGQGQAFGEVEGQRLGHQLADDDRDQRDEERHDHEGDRVRGFGDEGKLRGQQPDQAGESRRERHRANGARQKAEEGDRDLDRGEKPPGVLDQPPRRAGRSVPVIGKLVQTVALDRDEGHLAGGEEAADEDEDDDNHEVEDRVAEGTVTVHRAVLFPPPYGFRSAPGRDGRLPDDGGARVGACRRRPAAVSGA